MAAVEEGVAAELVRERLDEGARITEALLMGLRLVDGVDMGRLNLGNFPNISNKIKELIDLDVLESANGQLRVAAPYRPVLNSVLTELLRD